VVHTRTVVLITIDTWRRDATGFLGGRRPSPTPFLDGLAAEGLVAVDAVAPVPLTGPSHWSVLSGHWPWRDGLRVNGDEPSGEAPATLAQILRGHGWRTAAFVSCEVLDRRYGFGRGFEHYRDGFLPSGAAKIQPMLERPADQTVDAALEWLGRVAESDKVFIWVHLFDPHFPFVSPLADFPGEHGDYLAEVAFADQQVRRLADGLGHLGRPLPESMWVVVSDHGEGLGEHGESTHGVLLHGATTRIPLLIAGSSLTASRRETLVSTVDVFPTILGHLAIDAPERDGLDLLSAPEAADRSLPLESMLAAGTYGLAPAYGLRLGRWLWESSPADHLWDLVDDPREERDRATEQPEQTRILKEARQQFSAVPWSAKQPLEQGPRERLLSLGYASAQAEAGEGDVRAFCEEACTWSHQIATLENQGDYGQAEALVTRFLTRYPRSPGVWGSGGAIAFHAGDLEKAEQRLRRAVELSPQDPSLHTNLANVLVERGKIEEAALGYRSSLALDPDRLSALYNLGDLLAGQERYAEAARHWRRFVELYPEHPRSRTVRAKAAQWVRDGRLRIPQKTQ